MLKLKGLLERKENEIVGIASTETPDRDGEIIKQSGWDLTNFKANPVLLLFHNYQELPVGKITDLSIEDGQLKFKAVFSEATQKAKEAYQLVKEGILNTFSVGFIPREWDKADGSVITKAELLEISLVPVPANPEAVVIAKGLTKENSLAEVYLKHWAIDMLEKKEEETTPPATECTAEGCGCACHGNTTEVAKSDEPVGDNGEEKVDGEKELDIKLLQRTVGSLQQLLCEAKRKGGAK